MADEAPIVVAHRDDPTRALIAHVLQARGHATLMAEGPAQAYEQAQKSGVKLLLLEWEMCQRSTMALIPALRKHPHTKTCPVMVIGRPRSKEDLRAMARQGVQAVMVTTGFAVDAFLDKVTAAIGMEVVTPETRAEQAEAASHTSTPDIAAEVFPLTSPLAQPVATLSADQLKTAMPEPAAFPVLDYTKNALATLLTRDDVTHDRLARAVMRDPICMLQLLSHVSRSGTTREGQPIVTALEAIAAVGFDQFGQFVDGLQAMPIDEHPCLTRDAVIRSVAAARIGRYLADKLSFGDPQLTAVASLVHDMGRWMLHGLHPQWMQAVSDFTPPIAIDSCAVQRQMLGVSQIDGALAWARKWALPTVAINWAQYGWTPESDPTFPRGQAQLSLITAKAASVLSNLFQNTLDPTITLGHLPGSFAQLLESNDVSPDRLTSDIRQHVADTRQELTQLFGGEDDDTLPVEREGKLVYVCLKPPLLDPVALALQRRVRQFYAVELADIEQAAMGVPWMINLMWAPSTDAINRVLTRLLKIGRGKPGLLLLPDPCDREVFPLASHLGWPTLTMPMRADALFHMLDVVQIRAGSPRSAAA